MARYVSATVWGLVISAVVLTVCPLTAVCLFDLNTEWAQ